MEVDEIPDDEEFCPYCHKRFIQKDGCVTNEVNRKRHMDKCAKIHTTAKGEKTITSFFLQWENS